MTVGTAQYLLDAEKASSSAELSEISNDRSPTGVEGRLRDAVKGSSARRAFLNDNPDPIKETRTLLKVSTEALPNHLTRTTLAGPDRISVPPFVFLNDRTGSLLAFYHFGKELSGHIGLVHGGFLAVVLDECMGRACFPLLPEKIGVTVHMDLDYRSPVRVDSVVVIRAVTDRVEGRKAWTKATIETVTGQGGEVLVEARGLFVQPKWAATLEGIV